MYCQSCGTENPEDARFCKSCGTRIAAPGSTGGLIVAGDAPGASTFEGTAGSDTIQDDQPPRGVREAAAAAGKVDVETTLAGLSGISRSSLTNASLSFARMSLRSPTRSVVIAFLVVLGLVGIGAGASYAVMLIYAQHTTVIATTNGPGRGAPAPRVEIGYPEAEGREGAADLSSGRVSRSTRRRSKAMPSRPRESGGTKTPATPGATRSPEPDPPRSSSTTVDPPAEPSGAGEPPSGGASGSGATPSEGAGGSGEAPSGGGEASSGGASGGGAPPSGGGVLPPPFDDEVEERDIEMEMYSAQVRRVIARFYAARAQSCFDRATRNNHNLRGTVVEQFTIGPDGNVSSARPVRNTTGDDDLASCIAGQIRTWRLPVPPDEEPVTMQMPFSW